MTGDLERCVREMMRTYLIDTPVAKGGPHSKVIIEELGWFCIEDTLGFSGGKGGSVGGL